MPEITPKLGLKKRLGNETVRRLDWNENYDQLDLIAAREPFLLKSCSYDSTNDLIMLTMGPGRCSFLSSVVDKSVDSIFNISAPVPNTTYFVFLKSDGTFTFNYNGDYIANAVLLHSFTTGATVDVLSSADHRGEISGDAQSLTPQKIGAEPAFSKKSAFNKDFGTSTGTVADGGSLQTHKNDSDNPHNVTPSQIGAETPTGAQDKVNTHANRIDNPHQVTAGQIGATTTTDFNNHTGNKNNPHQVTATQVGSYTKQETDNKINQVLQDLDWKEHVATYADIATTYPNPEDGWTVGVDDEGTYRYNETSATWVNIGITAIPLATQTLDGKMSHQDKAKLDGIEAGAQANAVSSVAGKTGAVTLIPSDVGAEPAFTKNSAFNKNFAGSGAATTVSRSDHNHSGTYEPTFTKNSAFNKNFGTEASTVAEGKNLRIFAEQTDFKVYKNNKDTNGIFANVQYKRQDGTLAIDSTLSGGTSPQYTTRTIKYYGTDGTTVEKTTTRALSYDTDGVLVSEV